MYKLSHKYLEDSTRWREFLRDNDIKNPRRLVPGSELRIPLIAAPTVTVIYIRGEVMLSANDLSPSQPVEIGEKLSEGARISIGDNSYLSLQFLDGSIMRVLSNSVLRLRKVREASEAHPAKPGKLSRIMELERGDLDISVTPQNTALSPRKPRRNTFEIITPMAVAAVRGTRFDVSVSEMNTASGVTQGSVDVRQSKPRSKSGEKHALLKTGTGISVNSEGRLGAVRTLLPAPDLSAVATMLDGGDRIKFIWPAIPGAAEYHIRVASDKDMQQVLQTFDAPSPAVRLNSLDDGEYVIGIRAADAEGVIGYEAVHTFMVNSRPAFPLYLEPAARQKVGKSAKLQCTPVTDASAYHLQVSREKDFFSPLLDVDSLETCGYAVTDLDDGEYFWRVASITKTADGVMHQGPYSKPGQFDVDASQTADATETPSIAYWTEDAGMEFTLQISSDENFSRIIEERVLDKPAIKFGDLAPGIYYLRLQKKDAQGKTGAYSPSRRVEVKAVEKPSTERTWADKPK